jgi:hypothetical protein
MISSLFLLAMLGIVAIGALRPTAKEPPARREETAAEAGLRSPKIA